MAPVPGGDFNAGSLAQSAFCKYHPWREYKPGLMGDLRWTTMVGRNFLIRLTARAGLRV